MSVLQDLTSQLIQRGHVDDLTLAVLLIVHLLHSVWVALSTARCVAGHWLTDLVVTMVSGGTMDIKKLGIDGSYVDGLSLTHGAPSSCQHIWTFASGFFTGKGTAVVHVIMATPSPHLLWWATTIFVKAF